MLPFGADTTICAVSKTSAYNAGLSLSGVLALLSWSTSLSVPIDTSVTSLLSRTSNATAPSSSTRTVPVASTVTRLAAVKNATSPRAFTSTTSARTRASPVTLPAEFN